MVTYLDHAATTPVRPAAIETMVAQMRDGYGNPSGAHRMARAANRTLDEARQSMADALGGRPGEVVFTSGGTESDNLAVLGTLELRGGTAVCSAIEHHAVLDVVEQSGGRIVGVGARGQIDLDQLEATLDHDVSLVSVMLANNETGVVQPLAEVAEVVRRNAPNAVLHTDAVQAFPWLDVATLAQPADLVTVSAHKFGGPQGVGALLVREGVAIAARQRGGGQERERRSGTQNVAGIAAMATAATEMTNHRPAEAERIAALRDRLVDGLRRNVGGAFESGVDLPGEHPASIADRSHKTPNVAHLCFEGIESEALLFLLEKVDIMASAAASCSSGAMEPSHVLAAMGYSRDLAFGSLRLSLGYPTTAADIDRALDVIPDAVERLRAAV